MTGLIPRDSAPGVDDGGLRIARLMGGRKRGSFEVWSRTGSQSACVVAREDALIQSFSTSCALHSPPKSLRTLGNHSYKYTAEFGN